MCTYLVKVQAYYEYADQTIYEYGATQAESYAEAAAKVAHQWGDTLESMQLTRLMDDDVLFLTKDMYHDILEGKVEAADEDVVEE